MLVDMTGYLTRRSFLATAPLFAVATRNLRVELYLATECPISNRYIPELNRLAAAFATIHFLALFPEPKLTLAKLTDWQKSYQLQIPVALDPHAKQAKLSGATLTPEAAIFHNQSLLYRGRIDDRYVSWGKSRPQPTRRDVEETLTLLLQGKSPAPRFTKSWGCYIEAS